MRSMGNDAEAIIGVLEDLRTETQELGKRMDATDKDDEERHKEVTDQIDAVEAKVDTLNENILRIMRHLGIPEME